MKLYPAIDLKDGQCVRLMKGDMNAATIYNEDAAAQAKYFEDAGFDALHVVDLNGAVSGALIRLAPRSAFPPRLIGLDQAQQFGRNRFRGHAVV